MRTCMREGGGCSVMSSALQLLYRLGRWWDDRVVLYDQILISVVCVQHRGVEPERLFSVRALVRPYVDIQMTIQSTGADRTNTGPKLCAGGRLPRLERGDSNIAPWN